MNGQLEKIIKKCMVIAIILFCIRCFIDKNNLINNFSITNLIEYVGEAIGITMLLFIGYEKVLWKYDPLNEIPILNKRYSGKIISTYDNVEREARLEIEQTFLTLKAKLSTEESTSQSLSYSIDKILGEQILIYSYLNTPIARVRERSQIHYGTVRLCVDDVNILRGQYFTDRKTIGDMEFNIDN